MAPSSSSSRRSQTATRLTSGPWKGVFDTPDPFDADPAFLADALNCYIPDARDGSGVYARNGFGAAYGGATLADPPGVGYPDGVRWGQGIYAHQMLDGTVINFLAVAGRLLRVTLVDTDFMTVTDVTPPGHAISSVFEPTYFTSMVAIIGGVTQTVLIVSDGSTRPWVGTDLTSTPITGTSIDYDGLGSLWNAYGQPVVWQGALFCILKTVSGVARREDIAWSEPGDPFSGWQQTAFDNNMTVVLPGASKGPLTAIEPTNIALYYFRAFSIGAIAGPVESLQTSNTLDAISFNVGTTACRSIQQFGQTMFFADAMGRPYMLNPGNPPEPIWKQMRNVVRDWGTYRADELPIYASGVIEPTHNLYLVTLRRTNTAVAYDAGPTVIYVFDALTGNYFGQWTIADKNDGLGGIVVSCMGILQGADESAVLFVLGQGDTSSPGLGYGWFFRTRGFDFPDYKQWLDDGTPRPNVSVTTDRLGENEDVRYLVDRATIVTGNPSPCRISIQTPSRAFQSYWDAPLAVPIGRVTTLDGFTTVATVPADETFRIVVYPEQLGRGPAVRVWPTLTDAVDLYNQWMLHRITLNVTPSRAAPDDL